jgi:uncharacterized membrane protein SpoIIM required for sporulation
MVLESLVSGLNAESKPSIMFVHGFIYASLGMFLGIWIFNEQSSLIMVFLTTMAALPLIYNITNIEEKKDLGNMNESNLLKEHSRALEVFMFYFFGATIAFAFWYIILPSKFINNTFSVQTQTIAQIRSGVTGNASSNFRIFSSILSNNLKVLIFCILFSFIYGVGAIFILTWNASVIGTAIGNFIRTELYMISSTVNINLAASYFNIISAGLLRYSLHGIPEILSYFIAGLAGGIISTAATRHDFGTQKYINIIMDSSVLLLLSLFLVVIAAFLEVYITPIFF